MGNVCSANLGQAPARQAALGAGLPAGVICTTVNKVCASGMKSIMFAAQAIQLGLQEVVVAGGMESMSNIPYYAERATRAFGFGHQTLADGLIKDGLWDVYNHQHMGNCAEETAEKYKISRQDQDRHALESYARAAHATKSGLFKTEMVPVSVPQSRGKPDLVVQEDEEFKNLVADKVKDLKPAFKPNGGTVTAANASKLNDGASALVLMSAARAKAMGLKPLALVRSFADAEQDPKEFTTSPSLAIPKALGLAKVSLNEIALFELNEAFSVVACVNEQVCRSHLSLHSVVLELMLVGRFWGWIGPK